VKAAGKRQQAKVERKAARSVASLLALCLLPFALCLLPSLPAFWLHFSSSAANSSEETAAQSTSLHRWGSVTLFHGLPSDQVRAVAQDSDGVMWFGTDAGLARYDGRRIQTLTDEGLAGRRVTTLGADTAGALWVGTDDGAFVRAPGAETFRAVTETKGKRITALDAPEPGRAVLTTTDGMIFDCREREGGAVEVREVGERLTVASGKSQPLELTSVATFGETLVVGTRGRGLMTVEPNGEAKEVVSRPRAFYVETLERDVGGALFFGAQTSGNDSGIFKIDDGRNTLRPSKVSGVATGTVKALASSARGDLYVATEARGVFRFNDGRLVEHFTFAGTAGGLRSDQVNAVFVDREGVVWFGTPRGVCRYDPQGVRVEQLSNETEASFVRSLYRTATGRLLVGTNRGLFVRDDDDAGSWREVEEVAGKTVYSLAEDSRGLLLVGTGAGLYVGLQAEGPRPKSPVRLAPEEKAIAKKIEVVGEAGATRTGGKERKASGGKERRGAGGKREEKAAVEVEKPAGEDQTAGGDARVASEDEKAADGDERAAVGEEKPAGGNETREGGASAASTRRSAEPALSGSVRAIARFGDAVYVGTFGRGLERFGGPGQRALVWPRAGDDERGREVVSLYPEEARGRLWIGTANAGVFYFDGTAVRTEPALAPLAGSTVWGASAAGGWLWLATSRGLYAFHEGRPLLEVAPGVDARAIVAVTQGDANSSGVASDSSTDSSSTRHSSVSSLLTSSSSTGSSSTGSSSNGAGSSAEGVPRAWCATAGAGVLRVVLDEQFGAITSRLDTEQGLPTDHAFAVMQVAAASDADNMKRNEGGASLFVGTTRGLVRYEPGTLAPVLRLTRVTASRSLQPEELRGGALRLDYPQNALALDVAAAASRTFPEQFLYAFTLRDAKGRTIKQKLSRDSQFQVETLPAGGYTVTARAFTLDLVPSDPLVFNFEVARAPFPRTTVALSVLLALALVALVWGYVQHRKIVRSGEELREANRQLAAARLQLASEAEAERRRIARDLHDQTLADLRRLLLLTDEMQQGSLPAGTTGGALATATTVTDPSRLRAEIESISQEVRRICEDLSPSVLENVGFAAALEWALASACAQLPSARRFTYDFECEDNLEERLALASGVQMQVYRIVQEAVSNVCRHARAAHVSLRVRLDAAGDFLLMLEDDGHGFDANNKKALKGRGLAGIRARASLIEADAEWKRRDDGGTAFVLKKKIKKVMSDE
jgi:signal transduction histidine kinase/ligand-binding sensor domain-containing protein